MQLKKITVFTLFMVILLVCSLSAISAANQTINSTSTGGIAQGITDTGDKDTLFLQPGIYNKTGQDTNMAINKNITIQGNGSTDSVVIDAQGLSRMFNINNNVSVTFINITFINGAHPGNVYGGAILVGSANTVSVINCTFKNNTEYRGGAIYNEGNLTVVNSLFENNRATNQGGAIYSELTGSIVYNTLINSTFNNNTATGSGGTLAIFRSVLNITNCNFTNTNTSTLLWLSSCNNSSIVNSLFTNINASTTTGFLNIVGGNNNTIANSTFINNTYGVYFQGTNGLLTNCSFYNGSRSVYTDNSQNLTISNSTFINNSGGNGGTISVASSAYGVNIINNKFYDNTATNGGAIWVNSYGSTSISNNTFGNNSAVSGGAIYSTRSNNINVNVSNNTMIGNTASDNGGAIYNNGNMTVSGNTMTGNSADLGQMIYNTGAMGVLNLTFIDNSTWVVKNGSTITLYATLVDDMGNTVTAQNISFYLNGIFFENVTSVEGYANITYTTSGTGDIPVSGVYAGNGEYNILINNGLLKVRIPTRITISVPKEVKVGDTVTLESKLTDEDGNPLAGKTVDFYVDGKKVGSGVTDSDGIAKLNYTFTKAGKPNIVAKFSGDNTYGPSNATNSTTVSKIPTKITVKTNEDTITVTLTDEDGNLLANKKVTITINGKTYTKTTNSQGQIIIKYKNAWDYKVTANFQGDEKYLASKATAPKRTPTKVTIKTKGDKITATLTDKNGKPLANKKLTFRVKGVIIGVGITDTDGQVVIYYKNANKKAVTVSFAGDEQYAPSTATSTPTKSKDVQASGKVAMKNTGIPIIAILLALIASIGLATLRKRE